LERGAILASGEYHYVVMTDGSLRAIATDDMVELAGNEAFGPNGIERGVSAGVGHTSLAEGGPVHMAGLFQVDESGQIYEYDNWSGHYRPRNASGLTSLQDVAKQAFARYRLPLRDDAFWDYRAE
jgi:hypothetical protein